MASDGFDDFWGLGCDKGVQGDHAEPTPATLERASDAISHANFLLIAAGAGFSANSGLAVYKDVADVPAYKQRGLEYSDLARPHWRDADPELFFGFMGGCSNTYQDGTPHEGYQILREWEARVGAANTYVYTSNVDGFFRRAGFESVNEMHGCMQNLLCTRCGRRHAVDAQARYIVDPQTLQAPDEPNERLPGGRNHPWCTHCECTLRPEVVLFKDEEIKPHLGELQAAADKYQAWEEQMEEAVLNQQLNLVVLELGCGIRVPSVRKECEEVVCDLVERLELLDVNSATDCKELDLECRQRVTFIRVNPDYPLAASDEQAAKVAISLRMDALSFMREVNRLVTQQHQQEDLL